MLPLPPSLHFLVRIVEKDKLFQSLRTNSWAFRQYISPIVWNSLGAVLSLVSWGSGAQYKLDGNSEAKKGEENIEGGHSYVNSFYFSQRFLLENLTDIPYLLITLRRDKVSKLSRNNLSDQLNNIHPKFLCDNEGDDKTPIQQNRQCCCWSQGWHIG